MDYSTPQGRPKSCSFLLRRSGFQGEYLYIEMGGTSIWSSEAWPHAIEQNTPRTQLHSPSLTALQFTEDLATSWDIKAESQTEPSCRPYLGGNSSCRPLPRRKLSFRSLEPTGFPKFDGAVQKGYSSLLSFEVPDINSTVTKLISLGAEIDGSIKYEIHGKVAAMRCLDGHVVGLYEPA